MKKITVLAVWWSSSCVCECVYVGVGGRGWGVVWGVTGGDDGLERQIAILPNHI